MRSRFSQREYPFINSAISGLRAVCQWIVSAMRVIESILRGCDAALHVAPQLRKHCGR
jgi:hypothetical protein